MPKKNKTREQKILADKRRSVENKSLYTFTSTLSQSQQKQPAAGRKHTTAIATASYQYLAGDLRKTLLFTFLVIIAEVLIYYFTQGV